MSKFIEVDYTAEHITRIPDWNRYYIEVYDRATGTRLLGGSIKVKDKSKFGKAVTDLMNERGYDDYHILAKLIKEGK